MNTDQVHLAASLETARADAEHAAWLADKIVACGDYAKEAAAMLRRWPAGVPKAPAPLADEAFIGWKLVPMTPTMAMLDAASHKFQTARHSLAGFNARELAYKALLDAAPTHGVDVPAADPADLRWLADKAILAARRDQRDRTPETMAAAAQARTLLLAALGVKVPAPSGFILSPPSEDEFWSAYAPVAGVKGDQS